ncbi:meteorin-like protein [Astyanax mexicanus]|uniref:meteorin-like protein n=1 Tax=Astyanax mexicanus TaxID=7994 RepID=UPI0020CAD943|nr:meteorin-like protein [Astyanax mexicanus]
MSAGRTVCLCALALLLLLLARCARGEAAQYSSDQCSWRGSGLTHQSHLRDVEQVYLRCSEGSLEWLYPTGAIILNLRPNTDPAQNLQRSQTPQAAARGVCLRPRAGSSGASVFLRQDGELTLLLSEEDQASGRQRCFSLPQQGALFIEATAHRDISKRVTAFQYQLTSGGDQSNSNSAAGVCRSCTDEQILMAVCTSDFVVRGIIQSIEEDEDDEGQGSLEVLSSRVFRQKKRVFLPAGGGIRGPARWSGLIRVQKKCGLELERGAELLFTGSVRFGEAWLGCWSQYKDFLQIYHSALETGTNPCHIHTD